MSTDPTTPATSSPEATLSSRRWLLRGGAVAAGAAAVAALAPSSARAADDDPVTLGADNASSATTSITIGADEGGSAPTLALANAGGPSLYLNPLVYEDAPPLALGQLANTQVGPVIGVDSLLGETTTFLATGIDLADLPTPYALPVPRRLLDTRKASGRTRVLATSSGAFDRQSRLKAGAWLDLEIALDEPDLRIPSAYLNVTAVGADGAGYLTVYPPGDRPGTSTVNFAKGQTIANQAFVATNVVLGSWAVRIYANSPVHVLADLTGVTLRGGEPSTAVATARTARRGNPAAGSRLRSRLAEKLFRSLAR